MIQIVGNSRNRLDPRFLLFLLFLFNMKQHVFHVFVLQSTDMCIIIDLFMNEMKMNTFLSMHPSKESRSQYSEDAKEIVKNVHDFCKKEKEAGYVCIDLKKGMERTTALTGVSKSTIARIVKGMDGSVGKDKSALPRVERVHLDDFDRGVVRRTINTMYIHLKMLPTLTNIRTALHENIGYTGSREHLRKELLKLGYMYRRCKTNRRVLMERWDIVFHRIQYLRKIKQLREDGCNIVYTDETYVHSSHSVAKCWQHADTGLNIPFSKGKHMRRNH